MHVKPDFGTLGVGVETLHQAPEPAGVIELDEMADLVRGEIIEHEGGREDEPPGERQHAGIGARAPAARLVAHADALERNGELVGVAAARPIEIAQRLALEKIGDAARDMGRLAGNADEAGAPPRGFFPPPAPAPPGGAAGRGPSPPRRPAARGGPGGPLRPAW